MCLDQLLDGTSAALVNDDEPLEDDDEVREEGEEDEENLEIDDLQSEMDNQGRTQEGDRTAKSEFVNNGNHFYEIGESGKVGTAES